MCESFGVVCKFAARWRHSPGCGVPSVARLMQTQADDSAHKRVYGKFTIRVSSSRRLLKPESEFVCVPPSVLVLARLLEPPLFVSDAPGSRSWLQESLAN